MGEKSAHPILRSKAFWPIALGSAAGMAALAYIFWTQSSARRFAAERPVKVKVVAARKITVPAVAEAVGQLEASKETDAVSPLPGVLKEVRVKVGDFVKRGEVVAVLQAKELLERLDANESARKAAAAKLKDLETQVEKAEEKLATTRELYRKELIARREVEERQTLAATARAEKERGEAELAQREAALAQTRYLLGLTKIVAPASGIIARRFARPGVSIAASAAIVSVADSATMRIVITLAPAEARLVHPGMGATVRVEALPGNIYKGTVSNVEKAVEREGDSLTVQINVPNSDGRLKPALDVAVSISLAETRELIVVPRAAVFDCEEQRCVYVVDGRRARLRSIGAGAEISGGNVITSSLTEGEKVIVATETKIQPGNYLRILD